MGKRSFFSQDVQNIFILTQSVRLRKPLPFFLWPTIVGIAGRCNAVSQQEETMPWKQVVFVTLISLIPSLVEASDELTSIQRLVFSKSRSNLLQFAWNSKNECYMACRDGCYNTTGSTAEMQDCISRCYRNQGCDNVPD